MRVLDALRRSEGEPYGIRLTSDATGEVRLRPDGLCHTIQPLRSAYPVQLTPATARRRR